MTNKVEAALLIRRDFFRINCRRKIFFVEKGAFLGMLRRRKARSYVGNITRHCLVCQDEGITPAETVNTIGPEGGIS